MYFHDRPYTTSRPIKKFTFLFIITLILVNTQRSFYLYKGFLLKNVTMAFENFLLRLFSLDYGTP